MRAAKKSRNSCMAPSRVRIASQWSRWRILEPALSETTSITCITIIREAMDEAIRRGVPAEAARDFILGHINIELAIIFSEIPVNFSDGAIKAMERARAQIIQPDWKKVFEPENIRECLEAITKAPV